MENHWVTADLHFGDRFLARKRGFNSIKKYDELLVKNFNKYLTEESTLWVLGDASMTVKGLKPIQHLKGKKILVAGNHDEVWHRRNSERKVRKALQNEESYDKYFDKIYSSGVVKQSFEGQKVVLSHLPVLEKPKIWDPFKGRRPVAGDYPVLCGHIHNRWRTDGKQLNVGIDVNNFQPLKMSDAVEEVTQLKGEGTRKETHLPGLWNEFGLR